VERICTGTSCGLSLSCGTGQAIKEYSCDGVTWKVGGTIATKDCAPELKAPLTPLSQIIWCCGAPAATNPATGGGTTGTGGIGGASNPPTVPGAKPAPLYEWLAKNQKLQDFFTSEAAASAAFFAKFSPIVPAKPDGPFLVYANERDVINNSGVEIDLGVTTYKQPSPMVTVTLKNNSADVISLVNFATTGRYGVLQQGFQKVALSPGSMFNFQLKLDSATSGVKSASYTITYKRGSAVGPVETFRFSAGGIVWTSLQESKDNAKKHIRCPVTVKTVATPSPIPTALPTGAPDPCWRPARVVNLFFPKMGSEDLALAQAKTDLQFDALIPKLTLSRAEATLKGALPRTDIGTRLFKLVVIANRLMVSRGAVAALKTWSPNLLAARTGSLKATTPRISASEIQQNISQEILATLLPIIQSAKNDTYGQARSQLVLSLANINELKVLNRLTTSVLLSRGVEDIANLNGLGRYFMRAALARAYLSTNPPLEEADKVLSGVLKGLADPASKAPLAQTIYSQYPELWVAEHAGGNP
jgi:hypothetical protein